jgi:Tfp pilus assembly protein PilF
VICHSGELEILFSLRKIRGLCWASARSLLIPAFALTFIVVVAYHQAPENSFHFDDSPNITEHAPIRISTLTFGNLINAGENAFLSRRPVASITFAIDWFRGDGSPRAFLWTNIAIHALSAIAVFLLLSTILKSLDPTDQSPRAVVLAAFFGAALWAAHPIQTQAVTYIVQRMASLAALFTVLSVWSYLQGRSRAGLASWVWFGISALAFAAGSLTKETAWITPILVILAEICLVRRTHSAQTKRVERSVLAALGISALGVMLSASAGWGPLGTLASEFDARDFTMWERVLTQPRVLVFHLSQFFWPLPSRFSLSHEFSVSTSLLSPASTFFAWTLLLSWLAVGSTFIVRSRYRVAAFLILWLPATVAIEFSIFNLEMVFEHRMYLPTVSLAGLWALCCWFFLRRGPRWPVIVVNAAVVLLLVVSTQQRVPVWATELSLSQDAVRHNPNDSRALAEMGNSLLRAGRAAEAKDALSKALSINSRESLALEMMALLHLDEGNLRAAQELLVRANSTKSRGGHSLHNHWGELFVKQGKYSEARDRFRQAVASAPWIPVSYWNLAVTLERTGDCEEALGNWQRFLKLETAEERLLRVREHIRGTYQTPGGDCFK